MAQDLYAVLEVSRHATPEEIKRSYRRLARQYHPDVNKEPDAEQKFREVQKAYSILSDEEKKARYDRFGVADDSAGGGGFGDFSGTVEDIFESFFGGGARGGGQRRPQAQRGDDLRYDVKLSLEEAAKGIAKTLEIYHLEACSVCKGSGAKEGTAKSTCRQCQGSGQIRHVQQTILGSFAQVTTCLHCRGEGKVIEHPCKECHGEGLEKKRKQLKVDIPGGVDNGTRIRVAGEGNKGPQGGPAGDLYVFVSVTDHPYFRRKGDDLYLEVELPLTKAILGDELEVPVIDGKASLKIPAGTQPGTVFRLRGKGMPHLRGGGAGDQYVDVKVKIPEKLSKKEKDLIQEFAGVHHEQKEPSSILDYVKKWF